MDYNDAECSTYLEFNKIHNIQIDQVYFLFRDNIKNLHYLP